MYIAQLYCTRVLVYCANVLSHNTEEVYLEDKAIGIDINIPDIIGYPLLRVIGNYYSLIMFLVCRVVAVVKCSKCNV